VKYALLLLPAAVLAGCAPKPPVEVRHVPVPTPVTCVDARAIPTEPPRVAGRLTGNARRDLEIVAGSALDLRAWGREMRGLLQQCVGKAPSP
jgi:hypothetical protein